MARPAAGDQDNSLATRAAWLHYVGGLTQAAVARRLGLTAVKTHRLIARAVAEGVVKVSIDGDIVECIQLEERLVARYGLDVCEVTPELGEKGLPLRALGIAGANFLRREIAREDTGIIGIGHGRTLAASVGQLPRFDAEGTRFVSLLGGLTRHYTANPHDVMHNLTDKTGAQAHVLPVPFFANSEKDREILLAQPGVREIFNLANGAALKFAGIGTADAEAQLVASGMIEPHEISEINAVGAIGEMLGHFFDAKGRVLETTLSRRTLSVDLESGGSSRIVAIAGGHQKSAAIQAILNSGRLSGLITDEITARSLLD